MLEMIRLHNRAYGTAFMLALGAIAFFSHPAQAHEQAAHDTAPGHGDDTSQSEGMEGASAADVGSDGQLRELEAQIQALRQALEQEETNRVIQQARLEASLPAVSEDKPEDREFLETGRSLQMTNPEISLAADMLAQAEFTDDGGGELSPTYSLPVRFLGIHFQSVLDPFSFTKAAISFHPDPTAPVDLEELYITWNRIPGISLTAGRFREQFGVVNRWHLHAQEQSTFPFAMTEILGDEGLAGSGLSIDWRMPRLWAHANVLTVQVVQQANGELFSSDTWARPSALAHLKNYWDLNEDTYLELGLTDLWGLNHGEGSGQEVGPEAVALPSLGDDWGMTHIAGADLTIYWSPLQQSTYHSLTWRSEAYLRQQQLADETAPSNAWGTYSYLQYQWNQVLYTGLRGDYVVLPDLEDAVMQVTPYLTWWQSHFVYFRLEYSLTSGLSDIAEHRATLQVDWAAGPHKHERY